MTQVLVKRSFETPSVEIEPLKTRHFVTKSSLTIPLLFLLHIDIDLNIQPISLTLYIICVH